jgi:deoxyadenosine/deoxycytidine kinase
MGEQTVEVVAPAAKRKPRKELEHLRDTHGLFIVVEANIGAGKTEFCHMLGRVREAYDGPTKVLFEPVAKPRFKRLLGRFYQDPARWGFAFQMYALNERFKQHTLAPSTKTATWTTTSWGSTPRPSGR